MNSNSRGGAKVRLLAVHTTEGIMRARDLLAWTSWPGSSHAASDELGTLLTPADGFVPYGDAAWTLRSGNAISENIEQCAWARWTRDEWLARPKLLDATARWLADRSKARGIPLVKLSPGDVALGKSGVIGHVDWTIGAQDGTHTDPGPNYPWDVVIAKARAYAAPEEDDLPYTEAQLRKIISEELDKKLDDPRRADKFGNRLATLLRNTGADSSLNAIGAAVKALLGGSPPPTG